MAEQTTPRPLRGNPVSQHAISKPGIGRVRASSFKYYIHDSCAEFRLKLTGEMAEPDIAELNGCWRTAKTTLSKRKLVLDLRSLKTIDEAARNWVAAMSDEGAHYVPEDFLKTCVPGQLLPGAEPDSPARKTGLFSRLTSLFAGASVSAADSSTTQAR